MQDIVIVRADEAMTESEPPPSAMKWIYFKLSATPPREWTKIFDGERSYPRHSMWRDARIYGAHIKVHCPLAEAQRHLDDLKEDVQNANAKYRAWLSEQKQRHATEAEAQARDRQEVSDALGKLKF